MTRRQFITMLVFWAGFMLGMSYVGWFQDRHGLERYMCRSAGARGSCTHQGSQQFLI